MEDKSFEEELEKELYGTKPSKRVGRVKKIWGIRKKEIEKPETWEESGTTLEDTFIFRRKITKFFWLSFILFIISASLFSFVFYYRSVYIKRISINILGPEEVNSLSVYEYLIKIENNSKEIITDTKLNLSLQEGAYFYDDLDSRNLTFTIGDLDPNTSRDIKVKLIFLGNVDQLIKIKATLNYSTIKRNQIFELNKELLVIIKKEPINFQISLPSKVFLNEPFAIYIKGINNTDQEIDVNLELVPQESFEIISLSPPTENKLNWSFKNLNPNNSFEVNLTGKFVSNAQDTIILLSSYITFKNKTFSLKSLPISVKVLESPIILEIKANPEDNVVKLGSYINYTIKWINKSSIALNNVKVKVNLEGYFDFNSVRTDGYFDPFENSIIWDARNKPSLYVVQPGSSDSVTFSISTINKYPSGQKNLEIKVIAKIETETIPPEVQILTKKLTVETQNTKKIAGNVFVEPEVFYNDPNIKNTGPFPLQAGKSTTLSVYLNFSTFGEDFENIIVKTKIPIGVKLTGVFGENFNANNLQYNPDTGEFIYKIDELISGYGDVYPPYKIMFQIEVTPPLYSDPKYFVFLPPIEVNAQSKFTLQTFNIKTRQIDFYLVK
jgi:hypothetical protein